MTTPAEIITATRARVLGALPGAVDVSGDPAPAAPERLPAYALELSTQDSEPLAMNAPGAFLETATLTVSAWDTGGPGMDDDLRALAAGLSAVMLAAPRDLGDLVEWIRPSGQTPEIATGERRVGRVDVAFSLQFINRT